MLNGKISPSHFFKNYHMLILRLKEMPNIVAMVRIFWRKIQGLVLNTLAKFRLDMIPLTLSKERICLFV